MCVYNVTLSAVLVDTNVCHRSIDLRIKVSNSLIMFLLSCLATTWCLCSISLCMAVVK